MWMPVPAPRLEEEDEQALRGRWGAPPPGLLLSILRAYLGGKLRQGDGHQPLGWEAILLPSSSVTGAGTVSWLRGVSSPWAHCGCAISRCRQTSLAAWQLPFVVVLKSRGTLLHSPKVAVWKVRGRGRKAGGQVRERTACCPLSGDWSSRGAPDGGGGPTEEQLVGGQGSPWRMN